jgi:hypothetical protein
VTRAMHSGFYLVVEDSIYSCFLVSEFLAAFGGSPDFLGVLSAESAPTDDILEARVQFHANHQGASDWPEATSKEWERLYQPLQQSGLAMIRLFGLPSASMSQHTNTLFLGAAVNGVPARSRVESLLRGHGIWFVTYLTHLLQPWWMELAGSRILNCHSAVLPYARGQALIITSSKSARACRCGFSRIGPTVAAGVRLKPHLQGAVVGLTIKAGGCAALIRPAVFMLFLNLDG